jgi:hypothetical protein
MLGPSKYRKEIEKDLVAEQPGLGLAMLGLLIAVMIGMVVRVALSPERIRSHIEEALAKIPAETMAQVNIKMGAASVSLAEGIWPDLSLVIKDVKISSNNICWLSPQMEINELRLPLSWRKLLMGEVDMHELRADEVDLSLRNAPTDCPNSTEAQSSLFSAPARFVAQVNSSAPAVTKSLIRRIQVRKFLLHYLPVAFTTFEVDSFEANILSNVPQLIELSGKLNLGGDPLLGDYAPHAFLKARFDGARGPLWSLTARGDWREGRYDLAATYAQDKKTYEAHVEMKHLPLNQLMPLLVKYRVVENEYNGRQIWLAARAQTSGFWQDWQKNPVHVSEVKVEGDLGEIHTPKIELRSLQPLTFDPITLELRGLNLQQVLTFLNRPHPSPALGELGTFNGVATLEDNHHLRLRGDHSGLEFIFSNRGARETQTISLLSGEAEFRDEHWKIKIDRIRPLEGVFDGVIQMQADQQWRDLNVDSAITEMSLSPNVQTLMTGGGSLGAFSGKLKAHLVAGELKSLQGLLKSDRILAEGLHVEKPKFAFSTQNGIYLLDLNAQDVEVDPDSAPGILMSQVLSLPVNSPRFLMKNISARFQTAHLKDLQWTSFQTLIPQGFLRSHGGWSEQGDLFGEIIAREQRKENRWLIRGTRAEPVLQKAQHD